jgi:hypothetical protein
MPDAELDRAAPRPGARRAALAIGGGVLSYLYVLAVVAAVAIAGALTWATAAAVGALVWGTGSAVYASGRWLVRLTSRTRAAAR